MPNLRSFRKKNILILHLCSSSCAEGIYRIFVVYEAIQQQIPISIVERETLRDALFRYIFFTVHDALMYILAQP